ncbi:MAG TPA: hypothetical protein VK517_05890 [Cyclobacteriaceae bacterium]|nr:hypothetical protein [Cyclobacteriaceae bacterium]
MKRFVNRLIFNKLLFVVPGLSFCLSLQGQGLQDSLKRDEDDIVSSIAPYPADVREAILDISQYPQVLVKIERLQARTSQSFQDLIAAYPREVQENFYDLSRYPDLVSQLASSRKSADEVRSILSAYPQEVGVSVRDLYPSHLAELESMNRSYQQSQEALQATIRPLPEQAQADFNKVIGMPDVMNLLTDRIDLTVSLGEAYKSNPQAVRQNLASLNGQISEQNAKDLDDYKKQVASDPQLQEEMKKSSQDFANNYAETDDDSPTVVNNYYNSNPYPYWFGYPFWYPSPIWFPQPLYYHTGFYLGAGGNMVIVGLPSYAYSNWFFNSGYRTYPRIYQRYNAYYDVHRNYRTNINVYRGYNSAVHEHFSHVNNNYGNSTAPNRGRSTTSQPSGQGAGNTNRGRSTRSQPSEQGAVNTNRNGSTTPQLSGQGTINTNRPTQNTTTSTRSENFRNSINYKGSNLNTQPLNNFNSQQYHQQSWQGVGGARTQRSAVMGAPMQRSMGGGAVPQRSFGGGGGGSTGGARRGR